MSDIICICSARGNGKSQLALKKLLELENPGIHVVPVRKLTKKDRMSTSTDDCIRMWADWLNRDKDRVRTFDEMHLLPVDKGPCEVVDKELWLKNNPNLNKIKTFLED